MKRFTLTILAALIAVQISHAGWWKTFGGPTNDYGYCVQITSDSNYIIGGYKEGDGLWLIKTDTSGSILWSRTYTEEIRGGTWVEETSEGNYITACWSPSLVKVETDGDTLWTQDYGIESYCVQETDEGGYAVIGHSGRPNFISWLIKTDVDGDTIWTRIYEYPERTRTQAYFVQTTQDGGYIITGQTEIATEEYGTSYLWLVKTDSLGNTEWMKEYGTGAMGEFNIGRCVKQSYDGNYMVTGFKDFGVRGLWVLKVNAQGDTLWTKTYAGGDGRNIQTLHDGNYIITGGVPDANFNVPCSSPGGDLWLLKMNLQGDTLWTRTYGGAEDDVGNCVQPTSDSGYLVLGETWSFGAGNRDFYLLKTDSLGLLSVSENPITELKHNWRVLENVATQMVLSYSNMPQGFRVHIFDATGRKVDEIRTSGSSGTLRWGVNHPSGVYFVQVNEGIKRVATAKVVLIH